jgi:hypothetical protein
LDNSEVHYILKKIKHISAYLIWKISYWTFL